MVRITDLLSKKTVFVDLRAQNKVEALDILISSLNMGPEQKAGVKEVILERESIISTGIGKGIAIPHGKTELLNKNHAAFALLKKPLEFNAIDGEPISVIFLLAGPKTDENNHLKLLSRISRFLNNRSFRKQLKQLNTVEEVLEVFQEREQRYFPHKKEQA